MPFDQQSTELVADPHDGAASAAAAVAEPVSPAPLAVDDAAAGLAATKQRILRQIDADHAVIKEANARIRVARAELDGVERMLRAAKGPRRGRNAVQP